MFEWRLSARVAEKRGINYNYPVVLKSHKIWKISLRTRMSRLYLSFTEFHFFEIFCYHFVMKILVAQNNCDLLSLWLLRTENFAGNIFYYSEIFRSYFYFYLFIYKKTLKVIFFINQKMKKFCFLDWTTPTTKLSTTTNFVWLFRHWLSY